MVKLLVFAILLASSPASGLLEKLFADENTCYKGCHNNYGAPSAQTHLDACTRGCDIKLHDENCADQCKSQYSDEQLQDCCQVGCTLGHTNTIVTPDKPILAVDPIPQVEESKTETTVVTPEPSRPRSIILIRIRQRPPLEMPPPPSMENLFGTDPAEMFNNIIQRFQERAKAFEESIRNTIDEQSKDMPKLEPFAELPRLVQSIPLIRISSNVRADSSSESSEESNTDRSSMGDIRNSVENSDERSSAIGDFVETQRSKLGEGVSNFRRQLRNFWRREPTTQVWIFIGLLLLSSATLWYMLVSLCRHSPSRYLSVRGQELVFHPHEYEGYEKEKIQPDGSLYDGTEPMPIKVKLSNI